MPFVKVALNVPVPTLFDYRLDGATEQLIGARVLVPFGRKQALGVILEVVSEPAIDVAKVRAVTSVLSDPTPLPHDVIVLLVFCSQYYHHPIGEVIMSALPTRYRRPARTPTVAADGIEITAAGRKALAQDDLKRLPAQRRTLTRLAAYSTATAVTALPATDRRTIKPLRERGWAVAVPMAMTARPHVTAPAAEVSVRLTAEQEGAVRTLTSRPHGYAAWLLHGITGSGKTEVYLQLMASVLAAADQVLFLVPEIGLTPQLEARIRTRFGNRRMVTMHSGLADGERAANWAAAQSGDAQIVLGTRSAVFVPLPNLALVVVDEEHDPSYKQIESMRYSARDLAVWRARQRDVPVILGSATPSLETYYSVLRGRYGIVRLTRRASGSPLPQIKLVSTAGVKLVEGFAPQLLASIGERIKRKQQVLVFINRRGYAPVLVCPACGWAPGCHRCSARLVLHKPKPAMICHHCGLEESVPHACADCGNVDLQPLGYGTQRIEVALRAAFPAARVLRIDRDTTRARGSWGAMRDSIERRDVDLLIGTQLLSKGHDFAGLGLVCVLNADRSLYSADFRASELLFSQLVQVAGRAGRSDTPGDVLIQTAFPNHPLYQAVQAHDYDAYAGTLLAEREQAGFPPFVFQAVLRAEALKVEHALRFLHEAVTASDSFADAVTIFDPTPASLQRLKGRERAQLLVQSSSRPHLHRFLDRWAGVLRAAKHSRVRWDIDVDPLGI